MRRSLAGYGSNDMGMAPDGQAPKSPGMAVPKRQLAPDSALNVPVTAAMPQPAPGLQNDPMAASNPNNIAALLQTLMTKVRM